jgi:undecaprenyl diphosphate synthase
VSVARALRSGGGGEVPRHVAIIMDGNGRWAKKRHLPRIAGHRKGIEAARNTVRAAGEFGIKVLTLYAFSSENWRRPAEEVSDLMGLLRHFIQSDIDELHDSGVRLRIVGDYSVLSADIVAMIDAAVARTASNDGLTLVIALNYGSRAEIVRAARRLAEAVDSGAMSLDSIDEAAVERQLYTADLPPVDLLIRTSGEQRLSNFLLWQLAYAEFMFVETLWPDFGRDTLAEALEAFGARERRFGGL